MLPKPFSPRTTTAADAAHHGRCIDVFHPAPFGIADILDTTDIRARTTSTWPTTRRPQPAIPSGIFSGVIHARNRRRLIPRAFRHRWNPRDHRCPRPNHVSVVLTTLGTAVTTLPTPRTSAQAPLSRRVPQPPFHCFLTLAVLLQLLVRPAFALAGKAEYEAKTEDGRRLRRWRRRRAERQRMDREQWRTEQQREHGG